MWQLDTGRHLDNRGIGRKKLCTRDVARNKQIIGIVHTTPGEPATRICRLNRNIIASGRQIRKFIVTSRASDVWGSNGRESLLQGNLQTIQSRFGIIFIFGVPADFKVVENSDLCWCRVCRLTITALDHSAVPGILGKVHRSVGGRGMGGNIVPV